MVPGHEHPVVQTGVLACCLSVKLGGRQMIAPSDWEKLEEYPSLLEDIIELQKQVTCIPWDGAELSSRLRKAG